MLALGKPNVNFPASPVNLTNSTSVRLFRTTSPDNAMPAPGGWKRMVTARLASGASKKILRPGAFGALTEKASGLVIFWGMSAMERMAARTEIWKSKRSANGTARLGVMSPTRPCAVSGAHP